MVWAATLGLGLCVIGAGSCDDGLMTKGSYCSQLMGPLCDREIACDLGPASDRSGCLNAAQRACCGADGSCGERAPNAAAEAELKQVIIDCSAALMTFDCAQLALGNSPVVCGGTAASPPVSPSAPAPGFSSLASASSAAHLAGLRAAAAIHE
jgi:hypothetical protein